MIDFHAHLDLYPNPSEVIERCTANGVYVLSVTTTPSAWLGTKRLATRAPRIRTALGLHPQVAHQRAHEVSLFRTLVGNAPYVGEIGLDGSGDFKQHLSLQQRVFEEILDTCAREGGRVLSIHSRGAVGKVLDMLEKYPGAGTPILHWFTGSESQLERAISLGCWFSVGPAMLGSAKGRRLATLMPRGQVLTETDGPFAKVGGRMLEPSDVQCAVPMLSEIWGVSEDSVETQLAASLARIGVLARTGSLVRERG